ncbi:MAG: DUF4352 domain-containing protein [archaeon]|mgnify:CR=1 FL=1
MKRFLPFLFILLIMLAGCLQQNPEKITDSFVLNPYLTDAKVSETMQYVSKGQFAEGLLKVKATYNSAYLLNNYSYYEPDSNEDYFFEPQEGYFYLVVNVTLKNLNEYGVMTGANDFSVVDKEGYRFYPKSFHSDKAIIMIDYIDPNKEANGEMLFEIPDLKKNLLLQYKLASGYSWQINVNSLNYK